MTAFDRQDRNTRRHPIGNPAARRRQRSGTSRSGLSMNSKARTPDRLPCVAAGISLLSCGSAAAAWSCAVAGSERLTVRLRGLASRCENVRESEGFHVSRHPMTGLGRSFLAAGAAIPSTPPDPAGRRPGGSLRSAFNPPFRCASYALQDGSASLRRPFFDAPDTLPPDGDADPAYVAATREERGTRLALGFDVSRCSRVRFTLGSMPGIEERAG